MYAVVIITHWSYCTRKESEVHLFHTLEKAQDRVQAIMPQKQEPIITTVLGKTTWAYPSCSNGEESFDIYITNIVDEPPDKEVQMSMFDKLE